MGRRISLNKSNYYFLLVPWIYLKYDVQGIPDPSIPSLNSSMVTAIYPFASTLAQTIGHRESEYAKKSPLIEILSNEDNEELRKYLYKDGDRINTTCYIQFLELIAETASLIIKMQNPKYATPDYSTTILSPEEYEFALHYYAIRKSRINKNYPRMGFIKLLDADQKTKDEIRLLAESYGEYLEAGRGNRNKVCVEIVLRQEFRDLELENIREEYTHHDKYFDRLERMINEAPIVEGLTRPFSFTDEQKAGLIHLCATCLN